VPDAPHSQEYSQDLSQEGEESSRVLTSAAREPAPPPPPDDLTRFARLITTPPDKLRPDEIRNRFAELATRYAGTDALRDALDDLETGEPPARYRWPREAAEAVDGLADYYAERRYGRPPRSPSSNGRGPVAGPAPVRRPGPSVEPEVVRTDDAGRVFVDPADLERQAVDPGPVEPLPPAEPDW
jgi:hypothetical protein